MTYDNPIFDVNGGDDEMLLLALKAVFHQTDLGARGWRQDQRAGMILYWGADHKGHLLPSGNKGLSAEECIPLVRVWLESDFAKTVEQIGRDRDPEDYDVSIRRGFRVYIPTWENEGVADSCVICAIKPVCLWLGK